MLGLTFTLAFIILKVCWPCDLGLVEISSSGEVNVAISYILVACKFNIWPTHVCV